MTQTKWQEQVMYAVSPQHIKYRGITGQSIPIRMYFWEKNTCKYFWIEEGCMYIVFMASFNYMPFGLNLMSFGILHWWKVLYARGKVLYSLQHTAVKCITAPNLFQAVPQCAAKLEVTMRCSLPVALRRKQCAHFSSRHSRCGVLRWTPKWLPLCGHLSPFSDSPVSSALIGSA